MKSKFYSTVRLVKNKNSEKYWNKYKKGAILIIRAGGKAIFATEVVEAKTKQIRNLVKKDLEGAFSKRILKKKPIRQLRKMVLENLANYSASYPYGSKQPVVTQLSRVRVIRFKPYKEAKNLNLGVLDRPTPPVRPRRPLKLAEDSPLHAMAAYAPKVVFVDLRMVDGPLPYDIIEDITKLQKVGTYFVMFSDRPLDGKGSVEEILTSRLSQTEKEQFARYKFFVVSDNGNRMTEYQWSFPRGIPSKRVPADDLDLFEEHITPLLAARIGISAKTIVRKPYLYQVRLSKEVDPEAWKTAYVDRLKRLEAFSSTYGIDIEKQKDGSYIFSIRPQHLRSSVSAILEYMQQEHGVYANSTDVLAITEDKELIEALPGTANISKMAPKLHGTELIENTLGAMLGDYRENQKGDLAASASMIESFRYDPKGLRHRVYNYSIFMFMGHILHPTMNYALWRYRNEGKLPPIEDLLKKADEIWRTQISKLSVNLLFDAGETLVGYEEAMLARLKEIHRQTARALKKYPIVIGTEMPNLQLFDIYKNGELDHRNILRFVFDAVLARNTKKGLELLVVDFKSGQTPTIQTLRKNTQVLLYDLVARRGWPRLPVPYGLTGKQSVVSDVAVRFLYSGGGEQPRLHEWQRIKFEYWLDRIMKRMRKAWAPPKPKEKGKKVAKKKSRKTGKSAKAKKSKKANATSNDTQEWTTLKLPKTVPGLKIRREFAQAIIKGRKKIEYRTISAKPKPFVAIIQTFTGEEPGRPAEVVGFARIEKVTPNTDGTYSWHLSHVTPVKPYIAPSRPGAIIWLKDVPVKGATRLRGTSDKAQKTSSAKATGRRKKSS